MTQTAKLYDAIVDGLIKLGSVSPYKADANEPDSRYKSYGVRAAGKKQVIKTHRAVIRKLDFDDKLALARRLNTYIEFRNLNEEYRGKVTSAFIIADEKAVLYRQNSSDYKGLLSMLEPEVARLHLKEFEEPWQASAVEFEQPVTQA